MSNYYEPCFYRIDFSFYRIDVIPSYIRLSWSHFFSVTRYFPPHNLDLILILIRPLPSVSDELNLDDINQSCLKHQTYANCSKSSSGNNT